MATLTTPHASSSYRAFLVWLGVATFLNAIALGLVLAAVPVNGAIDSSAISPVRGNLYTAPSHVVAHWPFAVATDSMSSPNVSKLRFYEDGRLLGPSHSLHADIAEKGAGAYSDWNGVVHFSASDNGDPRGNGRTYTFTAWKTLDSEIQSWLLLAILAIDLMVAARFRIALGRHGPRAVADVKDVASGRRAPWLRVVALGAVLVALLLAATGLFGPIVFAGAGPPKDAALIWAVLAHALLGVATSLGLWASAAGALLLAPHFRNANAAAILLPAFPLSLVLTAVLAAVAVALPFGRPMASIAWAIGLVPLVAWFPRTELARLGNVLLALAPVAMLFGVWQGLAWHGPTATLQGSPSGDLTFYAGTIAALAAHPFPYLDLGYENGAPITYFNQLYPAFGAALSNLPRFDPFLFVLASGGTSYFLFTFVALYLVLSERPARALGWLDRAILVTAFIAAARYPYWIAESVPMVFTPALVIAVWWMSERGKTSAAWSLAAMAAALGGTALSKVTAAIVLVPLAGGRLALRLLKSPPAARLALYAAGLIAAAYCALMLARFLPMFLAAGSLGPESRRIPEAYFMLRDGACVLLIGLAWLIAAPPVAASLTLGLLSFLVYSFIAHVDFVVVAIIFGLVAAATAIASVWRKWALLTVLGLTLPAALIGEPSGYFAGCVWIACIGASVWIALCAAHQTTFPLRFRAAASGAVFTALVVAISLIGAARGAFIIDSGWRGRDVLTTDARDIWLAVRDRTPKDALIFTDQVDDTMGALGGWNTFAFSGQRQIFVSSWMTAPELRSDSNLLRDTLAINAAVISGERAPSTVPTKHRYGSFYAVVSAQRVVPAGWRKIYTNRLYALYEISAG